MASIDGYFKGKSVLLTGGSSGIGYAAAERLLKAGAEVTLVARRVAPLEEAKAKLGSSGSGARVHTLALDVSREDDVAEKVAAHLAAHPTDVLINNAGVVMPGRFLELESKHFREMMDINYFGSVNMCRAVIPHLVAKGGGAVLNVSSMAGIIGIYGYTAYAASKFALYGFSEALRGEMVPHKVQVSVCLPPDTDTPQLAFENQYKPKETKAIAGAVKTMSAAAVAEEMLAGVAGGAFTIIPGFDGRMTVAAQRWVPSVVRWYSDMAMKKAK
ncbi:MAG: SDR family oxidoreductase [Pseudomonadota bacterium]|nr:SDR family oxidoreductase [Pseudomonadota bacterium]